ncbi:MAG: ABC transporter ATP-binding protein [Phycisphaerales bacterium]|nr:ABC transporter ATP-binding protein [Phycisphaerales bacterium]
MPTAVHIQEIVKTFPAVGGAPPAVACDHISLSIEPGELYFLLGPSGCGKTTLLRMIAGFIDPTSGRILFDESDVTFMPPNRRNTGMVFQSYALWPHMTVQANVEFGLSVRKVPGPERARAALEALAAVKMEAYAKRKPNQLSGGQQQRVALARALVIRPSVLLLDEPLSNLDAKLRIELRGEIRRICKSSGITTIYVTHDQKEALSMADRVAILEAGRVVQTGPPAELYRRPRTRFVAEFLGETNFLPATVTSADGPKITVETAAGAFSARAEAAGPWRPGAGVLCSVRPEALRIGLPSWGGMNTMTGRVVETTYLGEMAQHVVELKGGLRVKAADLNPREAVTGTITIGVAPEDVVLLPA